MSGESVFAETLPESRRSEVSIAYQGWDRTSVTATKSAPVKSAHVTIARTIGIEIVTGEHLPGTTIPGEFDLADRFGVARTVIREALRMLTAKGLIESRRKTGTRVRERTEWALLDAEMLSWMFEAEPPVEFVRSLFELRLIVEPAAAALAANKRTAAQLARMGHALQVMTMHGLQTAEGQEADQQFHAVLLEATANELLGTLSGSISLAVRWTTFFKHRSQKTFIDSVPQHQSLFEAIARADTDAARVAAINLIEQAERDANIALEDKLHNLGS